MGKRLLFYLAGLELGGAERQALYLARYLKDLGADVRVWGVSGPGLASRQCEDAGIPWSVQPSVWPCRRSRIPRAVWRVGRTAVALLRLRTDLILAYCPQPCVSSGLVWRWSKAKALVWGQRDCDDLRGDPVERFAYRRASAVICNAEHEIEYLRRTLGQTKAMIRVVHNGIELPPPVKGRAEWRKILGVAEGVCAVTMLANFRLQKDHATVLRAWRQVFELGEHKLGNPVLILAGAPQESFAAVQRLAEELKLMDSIRVPGQVQDVAGLLAASDLGVLMSRHEGLSNSILEYMASGLPVIAADLPANREALGEHDAQQLVPGGDPMSLATKLLMMLQSDNLRAELGTRNRQRAETEFSLERMCQRSARILSDLIRTKRSSTA